MAPLCACLSVHACEFVFACGCLCACGVVRCRLRCRGLSTAAPRRRCSGPRASCWLASPSAAGASASRRTTSGHQFLFHHIHSCFIKGPPQVAPRRRPRCRGGKPPRPDPGPYPGPGSGPTWRWWRVPVGAPVTGTWPWHFPPPRSRVAPQCEPGWRPASPATPPFSSCSAPPPWAPRGAEGPMRPPWTKEAKEARRAT